MKQHDQSRVGLGAASLIMILLVLCLALMGVLSLMAARADLNLSRRHAQLAGGYQEASSSMQAALAELDEMLADAQTASSDEAQYAQQCMRIERAGDASVHWEDDEYAILRCDAGEERLLEARIERKPWEKAGDTRYSIAAYRLIDVMEWGQTDGLVLMDMDI